MIIIGDVAIVIKILPCADFQSNISIMTKMRNIICIFIEKNPHIIIWFFSLSQLSMPQAR